VALINKAGFLTIFNQSNKKVNKKNPFKNSCDEKQEKVASLIRKSKNPQISSFWIASPFRSAPLLAKTDDKLAKTF